MCVCLSICLKTRPYILSPFCQTESCVYWAIVVTQFQSPNSGFTRVMLIQFPTLQPPRLTELTCCNNLKVIWICHKVRSVIGRWTHSKDICTGERIDYVSTKLNIQSSAYSTVLEGCALNFGLVGRFDYSLQILESFC